MSKQINKIVDNYPVLLNRDEKDNLVKTLSSIILEVAPGGSGGGKTYYGAEGVYVDNDNNRITLESTAKNAIDNIPHAVTDLTDSADYQLKSGMTNYLTTATYETDSATFLTKTSASQNLAPISVTADIEALKTNSGDFSQYYKKTDTSSKEELSAEFDKYQTIAGMNDYVTNQALADAITNLDNSIALKQNKLTFGYDENNYISSIDGSALAGQGGTTYTEGNGISIASDTISISADYIQAITSVSGKQDELAFTYNTSNAITHINGSAIAGEGGGGTTVYSGTDGVYVDGNNIGLSADYKAQIETVSSKLTKASADTLYAPISVTGDVDTLKSSSGNWDKVSDKLDTTAFSTVSGSFLTSHQSLDNYYTKTQVDSTFASATQLNDYLTTATYQTDSGTFLTKSSADNDYAPKSVTATVNTLTGASASWNEVSAKLGTAQYANDSATFVTSSDSTITGTNQYALTTAGWAVVQGGSTFTGVTTTGSISGGGVNNDTIGLLTSAENALTSVANKVDKPDTTQTVLNNNYLIYSTLTGEGTTTGWMPLSANYYSKTEADGRYQKTVDMSSYLTTAQYETDSATFVTSSNSTITGTKQYALTTAGWAEVSTPTIPDITANNGLSANGHTIGIDNTNLVADTQYAWTTTGWSDIGLSAYLPLSGGTVSGELVVSAATGTFDNSYVKCVNNGNDGYARFGVGSYGGAVIKAVNGNNNVQVNVKYNTNNNELIQVQKSNTDIGFLIPAQIHQGSYTPTSADGILHIVLES